LPGSTPPEGSSAEVILEAAPEGELPRKVMAEGAPSAIVEGEVTTEPPWPIVIIDAPSRAEDVIVDAPSRAEDVIIEVTAASTAPQPQWVSLVHRIFVSCSAIVWHS